MTLPSIIAIDGPAASGKSTLGEMLGDALGYMVFDTGVMYRAATFAAMETGTPIDNENAVSSLAERIRIDVRPPSTNDGRKCDVLLDGKDVTWKIRSPEVEANVSQVSAYSRVRKALTDQQRRIASRGSVVMVGRDIGTVVCPDAGLKLFMVASVEERAKRRYEEIRNRNESTSLEEILSSMRRRDQIDSNRKVAPLKPAADAVIIETDGQTIVQVLNRVKSILMIE